VRLKGKVAVVTGAGSGMGLATVRRFVAEGASVVCADVSGAQEGVAADLGDQAVAVQADVSDADAVRGMIAAAVDHFGRLDVLVNNAGFGGGMALLHEQPVENWDRVHAVNLRGVFLGMKYAVPALRAAGGGAIVNVASATALVGWKRHSVYGAAKAGVVQLTRSGALDYAGDGIRVNAVAPGTIWTGLVAAAKDHPEPPPGFPRVPGIPMDRWGTAEEIANAVTFLASDEASYVTGVVLPVDGGYAVGYSGMGAEIPGE
jgi:NAD(P)-dependent dehydrogenase (short-subunit alcohol dehydrogenase family)